MAPARLTRSRSPWLILIGVALLIKALVPAGWMASADAHAIRVELCSGWQTHETAPLLITFDASAPGHDQRDGDDDAQQPCTFAAAALPWIDASAAEDDLGLVAATAEQATFPSLVTIGHGLAAPPPPATGPPSRS